MSQIISKWMVTKTTRFEVNHAYLNAKKWASKSIEDHHKTGLPLGFSYIPRVLKERVAHRRPIFSRNLHATVRMEESLKNWRNLYFHVAAAAAAAEEELSCLRLLAGLQWNSCHRVFIRFISKSSRTILKSAKIAICWSRCAQSGTREMHHPPAAPNCSGRKWNPFTTQMFLLSNEQKK